MSSGSFGCACVEISSILLKQQGFNTIQRKDNSYFTHTYILEVIKKYSSQSVLSSRQWKKLQNIIDEYFQSCCNASDSEQSNKSLESWETIHNICVCNPEIQTYVTLRGVHSKQPMFDSFRHVMRNLIIGIAVVNAYSIWHPVKIYQDIARYFINGSNTSENLLFACICFTITILLMFVRYNHFVFLRYKYSYEHFIHYTQTKK